MSDGSIQHTQTAGGARAPEVDWSGRSEKRAAMPVGRTAARDCVSGQQLGHGENFHSTTTTIATTPLCRPAFQWN